MPYNPKDKRTYNNAELTPIQVVSLKKKAVMNARLSLRVSGRRFEIPVDVALLQSDEKGTYSFISVPGINAVVGLNSSGTSEPVNDKERDVAVKALQAVRVRAAAGPKAKPAAPELPAELLAQLKKSIPAGYKLLMVGGEAKLVKTRPARKGK